MVTEGRASYFRPKTYFSAYRLAASYTGASDSRNGAAPCQCGSPPACSRIAAGRRGISKLRRQLTEERDRATERTRDDAWARAQVVGELRGLRAPGTGIPGVIALGTWRSKGAKDFAAVYRGGPAVVVELARAGIAVRAHRRIAAGLARLRLVCESLPAIPRFSGKLDQGEVLLWPPEARKAASLAALGDLRLALVSGAAADSEVLAHLRLRDGFALTNLPSFAEIVAAVEATGAPEVALFAGAAESVAALLRQRGLDAYALGPPQQMTLPAGK